MAEETRLRLVQVGVGGWGETWLDRVCDSPDWELAAIVDADPDTLAAARDRKALPASICFASVTDAARAVQADAALVVVPVEAHLAVATEVLEAGWHALVEKPLADTMEHAHELVARAELAGRTLMVSQNYRFRRGAEHLTRIMAEGWLGPVHFASVHVRKELHFVRPDVPHGFGAYRFARDAAVHHLDQIRACLGVEVSRVYGRSHNPEWSWFTQPPMICGLLDLEGGGVVDFYGSWIARGAPTSFDGDWHVECANGQVRWSGNRILVRAVEPWLTIQMDGFLEREDGWMEAELPVGATEDRTRVLEVFHDCLRDGREPPTSGRDNLRTAALAFALEDSARDGAPRDLAGYLTDAQSSRRSPT
jgi:predicted dehydrogenase